MVKPSSFCTVCTNNCVDELVGFLLSLSIHHKNEKVYVMCDTESYEKIIGITPQPKLNITWLKTLDKYSKYDRDKMVELGIWGEFQMAKADVISEALKTEKDTLFLDSDTIILDMLDDIDNTKELGVSPQFIKKKNVDETGYYNGGMLWTNQRSLPDKWREFTKTSRYFDQASIEDLVKVYDTFEFGDNYNIQTWRFILGLEPGHIIASHFNVKHRMLRYKDKPIKFIHTHFNSPRFKQVNDFFIEQLKLAKYYSELAVIYRVINGKWVLKIPKQPMTGMWNHKNDSFRELTVLYKTKIKDVDIELNSNSGHCWLSPNIMLYDRPTLEWFSNEMLHSCLVLFGNGDKNNEINNLKVMGVKAKPWIFWPRRPIILEFMLSKLGYISYEERKTESIFIGNYENSVQEKWRKSEIDWKSAIEEFHCTSGSKHKFTQQDYLKRLSNSKYGLCLRGYGSKCHREVELMAFGTVPIITPGVSIKSYMDPPVENEHYIKVSNTEEIKEKIKNISKHKWEQMSKNCVEWYKRNVHSENSWVSTIENILYD